MTHKSALKCSCSRFYLTTRLFNLDKVACYQTFCDLSSPTRVRDPLGVNNSSLASFNCLLRPAKHNSLQTPLKRATTMSARPLANKLWQGASDGKSHDRRLSEKSLLLRSPKCNLTAIIHTSVAQLISEAHQKKSCAGFRPTFPLNILFKTMWKRFRGPLVAAKHFLMAQWQRENEKNWIYRFETTERGGEEGLEGKNCAVKTDINLEAFNGAHFASLATLFPVLVWGEHGVRRKLQFQIRPN